MHYSYEYRDILYRISEEIAYRMYEKNNSELYVISNEIKTSIRSKGVIYDVCVGIDNNIFVDMEAQNRVDNEMALKRRMIHLSKI